MSDSSKNFLTPSAMARILSGMRPLCELLQAWREALALTPAEAARRCEISPQLWGQIECGATKNPRGSTLLKLARGTGIPMEILAAASYPSNPAAYLSPPPESAAVH